MFRKWLEALLSQDVKGWPKVTRADYQSLAELSDFITEKHNLKDLANFLGRHLHILLEMQKAVLAAREGYLDFRFNDLNSSLSSCIHSTRACMKYVLFYVNNREVQWAPSVRAKVTSKQLQHILEYLVEKTEYEAEHIGKFIEANPKLRPNTLIHYEEYYQYITFIHEHLRSIITGWGSY